MFKRYLKKFGHYVRRGILGSFKSGTIVSWVLAVIVNLCSVSGVFALSFINTVVILTGLLGGCIELGISLNSHLDKKLLPIWNGIIQFSETLLLKMIAYNFLLLRNMRPLNPKGSLTKGVYIPLLVLGNPVLLLLSALSGFGEYYKYDQSRSVKTKKRFESLPRPFKKKFMRAFRVVVMSIDAAATSLALIEIVGTIAQDIVNRMFLNDSLSLADIERAVDISRLVLAPLSGVLGGLLGVHNELISNRFQRQSQKGFFVLNELIQTAAFTLIASVEFHKSVSYDLLDSCPSLHKYIFSLGVGSITLFNASLRVLDEYRNKYYERDNRRLQANENEMNRRLSDEQNRTQLFTKKELKKLEKRGLLSTSLISEDLVIPLLENNYGQFDSSETASYVEDYDFLNTDTSSLSAQCDDEHLSSHGSMLNGDINERSYLNNRR